MLGNDISDEVPPRFLVHVSDIFQTEVRLERLWPLPLGLLPRQAFEVDLRRVNAYEGFTDRGIRMELFHYLDDGWPGDELYENLDGISHPFHTLRLFSNLPHLQAMVDYSRDIRAVIDPLHPLGFGVKSGLPFGFRI